MNDLTTSIVTTAGKVWDTLVTAEKALEKAVKVVKPATDVVGKPIGWSAPPAVVSPGIAAQSAAKLGIGRVFVLGKMAVDAVTQGSALVYKAGQLATGSRPLTESNLIRIAAGMPLENEPISDARPPGDLAPQKAAPTTHPAPSATVEVHSSPNRPVVVPYREGFVPASPPPGPWRADGPTGTAHPPQQLSGAAAAVKLPPPGKPPAAGAPPAGSIPPGRPENDNGEAPPVKLYPMPPRSEESGPRDSKDIKPVEVIAPQFSTPDDRYLTPAEMHNRGVVKNLWDAYNSDAAKIGKGKTSSTDPMMSTDPKADVNKKEKSSNTDAAEGSPPTNLGSTNAAPNEVIALRITGGQTTPNFGRIMGEAVQEMTEAIQGGRATDLDSFMGIAAHARGEVQWRIYPHSLPSFGVLREPGSATFTPIAEGYPRYHGLILEAMQRNSFGSPDTRASDAVLTEFGLDTFLFGRMFTAARGAEIYKREISIDGNKVPLTLYVRAPDGEVTLIHPAVSSYTNEPYTKAKRYCDKLYNELKDLNTHLTPEETIRKLALLHYTMAHLMPYARGSAAITHTTIVALAKARGFQVGRIKPDVQPDMEAFLRDPEDYVRNYPNMFDHTSASDSHVDQPSEPEEAPSSKTPRIRRW